MFLISSRAHMVLGTFLPILGMFLLAFPVEVYDDLPPLVGKKFCGGRRLEDPVRSGGKWANGLAQSTSLVSSSSLESAASSDERRRRYYINIVVVTIIIPVFIQIKIRILIGLIFFIFIFIAFIFFTIWRAWIIIIIEVVGNYVNILYFTITYQSRVELDYYLDKFAALLSLKRGQFGYIFLMSRSKLIDCNSILKSLSVYDLDAYMI